MTDTQRADAAALFRQYYGRLVRFIVGRGADWETARDLASSAFMRLIEGRQAVANPRAYLFQSVRNGWIDLGRRATAERRLALRVCQTLTERVVSTPDDELEELERRDRVAGSIAHLNLRQQAMLAAWAEGRSSSEIAAAGGIAVGAVGTTLHRLRRRLRQAA